MNHDATIKELNLLVEDTKVILGFWRSYIEKTNKVYDTSVYSAEYIEKLKQEAKDQFAKSVNVRFDSMQESIENIVNAEHENENIVDINNESLQSAFNMVNAMREKTTFLIINNIVKSLRGDFNSLQMVQKLFNSFSLKMPKDTEKYFSKPSTRANDIKKALDAMNGDKTNVSKLISFNRAITDYAELIGVELGATNLEIDPQEFINTSVRAAMGL